MKLRSAGPSGAWTSTPRAAATADRRPAPSRFTWRRRKRRSTALACPSAGHRPARELTYSETKSRIEAAFPVHEPYCARRQRQSSRNVATTAGHRRKRQTDYLQGREVRENRLRSARRRQGQPRGVQALRHPFAQRGLGRRRVLQKASAKGPMQSMRGKLSYGDSYKGVPIVEKIETWHYQGREGRRVCCTKSFRFPACRPEIPSDFDYSADAFH